MNPTASNAPSPTHERLLSAVGRCQSREELSDGLRAILEGGGLPAGSPLPSIRKLQQLSGLRYHEVYGALVHLEEEGYVERRRGSGTYVRDVHAARHGLAAPHLNIGILPPIWDPGFAIHSISMFLSGISMQADSNHRVQLLPTGLAAVEPGAFLAWMQQLRLDGLIWLKPPISPPPVLARLPEIGLPVVLIGRSYANLPVKTVDYNFAALGEAVAEYLVKHQRRKLILMAGVRNDHRTTLEIEALRASLAARGLTLPDAQIVTVRLESAAQTYSLDLRESLLAYFRGHPDFDAVLTFHDEYLSVLSELHNSGFRRCPEDFIHIHHRFLGELGGRPCPEFPSAFLSAPSIEAGRQAVLELEKMRGIADPATSFDCSPRMVFDPY